MAGQSLFPNSAIRTDIRNLQDQSPERMDGSDSSTCCGICLCDNGRAVRGHIDSCDHYFCFVCIMEWAKVESRCPMCKRRFSSIRRPPKHDVFLSERIVNVPRRDQVYHISGNATAGPFDPYGQISCSVCNTDVDESLLLLCDLCDCASHTYCVGLGATVPEGDWFCNDCSVSRTEHENIYVDSNDNGENALAKLKAGPKVCVEDTVENQNFVETSNQMVEAESDVSIFEIVCEMNNRRKSRRLSAPVAACGRQPVVAEKLPTASDERTSQTEYGERRCQSLPDVMAQTNARTLSRCRNVHGRIRALRENWNSLQSGSLTFSFISVESGARSSGNRNALGVSHDSSVQDGFCSTTREDGCSDDIDKAWKMMDRAKLVQKATKNTQRVSPAFKCTPVEGSALKISSAALHSPKRQQVGTSYSGNTANTKQPKQFSLGKEDEKHVSLKLEKLKRTRVMSNEVVGSNHSLPIPKVCAAGSSTSLCNRQEHTSSHSDVYHDGCPTFVQKTPSRAALNAINNVNHRVSKPEMMASSSIEGKVTSAVTCVEHEPKRDDDAKRGIQSLVKLNLKLLSRDKQLEVETFKRIARLATHTILAACGLEHSRNVTCSLSSPICSHFETIDQLGNSSLMPNSCQECFLVFVKNVVNSTLSDRVSHFRPC